MKRHGSNSLRLLLGLLALLGVACFLPIAWTRPVVAAPRHFLDTVTSPFTVVLRKLGQSVAPPPGGPTPPEADAEVDWYEQFRLQKQHSERLQIENDELRRWMRQFEQLDRIVGPGTYNRVTAYVTAFHDGDTPHMVIDRGSSSGVARGQAVIHGDHILGIVDAVGPVTARVLPMLASPTSLRVFFTEQRAGVPERPDNELYLEPNEARTAYEGQVERGLNVRADDLAVLADRRYPGAHFFLGRVRSVQTDPDNLAFNRVVVEPEVRPGRVRQVVVLVPVARGATVGVSGGGAESGDQNGGTP